VVIYHPESLSLGNRIDISEFTLGEGDRAVSMDEQSK